MIRIFDDDEANNAFMANMGNSDVAAFVKRDLESRNAKPKKKKNFLLDQLSTAGGILGGIGGSFISPIAGTAAGAGAGSALGEALEKLIDPDSTDWGNVAQEGVLGAAFGAGPIKLAKGGVALAAGKGLSGASTAANTSLLKSAASKTIGGNAKTFAENKATTNLLKLTPAQTQKLLDAGVDPTALARKAAQFGGRADEIIGKTGNSGPLQATIRALEDGITQTAKTAGKNVRIPGDELLKALKLEAKSIKTEIGGGPRLKAINQIIKDVESKYAKGITVQQARNILREGNQRFGASILDDTGDAVARAAQKLEANTMRSALKTRFPGVAKALDDEGELIQLREILKKARAVDRTGKFSAGRLDLTRPGTFADPLLNSRTVSRGILGAGGTNIPQGAKTALGVGGRLGVAKPMFESAIEPQGLEDALLEAQSPPFENSSMMNETTPMPTNMANSVQNMDTPYSNSGEMSSGITRESALQAMMLDIQQNGGKNVDKIMAIYEFANPEPKEQKGMNSTAANTVTDLTNGITNIRNLSQRFKESGANKPIIGDLLAANPFNTDGQTLRADIARVKQVIGKALEGGVLRKEDEVKYAKILPTLNDSDEVAQNKINAIADDLERKLYLYQQNIGGGNSLEDALLQYAQ